MIFLILMGLMMLKLLANLIIKLIIIRVIVKIIAITIINRVKVIIIVTIVTIIGNLKQQEHKLNNKLINNYQILKKKIHILRNNKKISEF